MYRQYETKMTAPVYLIPDVCVLHIIHGFGWVGVVVIYHWDGYTQYSYDIVYFSLWWPSTIDRVGYLVHKYEHVKW